MRTLPVIYAVRDTNRSHCLLTASSWEGYGACIGLKWWKPAALQKKKEKRAMGIFVTGSRLSPGKHTTEITGCRGNWIVIYWLCKCLNINFHGRHTEGRYLTLPRMVIRGMPFYIPTYVKPLLLTYWYWYHRHLWFSTRRIIPTDAVVHIKHRENGLSS